MKFNFHVDMDISRPEAWRAWEDHALLDQWQPTLVSVEHKSGMRGQPGAVAELTYSEKGRSVVVRQTITERRQPDFRAAIYETHVVRMLVVDTFETNDDGGTRWTSWVNVTFKGMMRILVIFTADSVRKRVDADMQRFKLLAETRAAGRAT